MEDTQEKNIKYGKNSILIRYNNIVVNDKNTNIIPITILDDNTSKNVCIFLLKYTLNTIPYEVVMGKLQLDKSDGKLGEKSKIIQEFLLKQIEVNSKGINDYEYCKSLDKICDKKNIPFIYTDEGINIVTNSGKEDKIIERTYYCNEEQDILKLECMKPEKKMDLYVSEANIRKSINEKVKQNKAIRAAKEELTPDNLEKFNLGKKIKNYKNLQSKDIIFSTRKALVNYLIQEKLQKYNEDNTSKERKLTMQEYMIIKHHFKEKENRDVIIDPSMILGASKEETLAEKYFRLKEKAIAIDIKQMLEETQEEYLEEMNNEEITPNEKGKENIDIYNSINNYKTLFDFIKQGQDINTRFCYVHTQNGFDGLIPIIEKQLRKTNEAEKSEEIMRYLKLKENLLKNVILQKGKGYIDLYNENKQSKEFVEFVMKTNSRIYTINDEK